MDQLQFGIHHLWTSCWNRLPAAKNVETLQLLHFPLRVGKHPSKKLLCVVQLYEFTYTLLQKYIYICNVYKSITLSIIKACCVQVDIFSVCWHVYVCSRDPTLPPIAPEAFKALVATSSTFGDRTASTGLVQSDDWWNDAKCAELVLWMLLYCFQWIDFGINFSVVWSSWLGGRPQTARTNGRWT